MHHSDFKRGGYPCRLRHACRTAFAALTLLIQPSYGQTYENGLHTGSVNPASDAAFIREMREKMDSIHRNEHRPTVALVLSGGGAKGASQVGVVKYVLDMGIPIDMICGTSIGGLIGGLVSVGYDPEFIENLFRTQDWGVTLTDRVDRTYYTVAKRLRKDTYLVNIPFHYKNQDFQKRVLEQERYSQTDGRLHVSAGDGSMQTRVGVNNLASSLPSGYVYGFNVNNLLASLTVGYHDSLAFKDLPVPFYCVAADLLSCKAKNWGSGQLKTAMRSTMSIPGLFDPVRTEGMVLVDGGIRNNFPVDLARTMGADLVIGIDLSDEKPVYSELNNIGNFVGQFIRMLGQESFQKNFADVDVLIKPDTRGFNMLSFNAEAVDTLVARGYAAARAREDALRAIKKYVGNAVPHYSKPVATNIAETDVQLSAVIFDGLSDRESRMMQDLVRLTAGEYVGKEEIDDAMSKIQATGCFESVTYSLLGKSGPYRLVFNCSRSPVHQLGVGLRMDTEEWPSILLNLGLNAHKLSGFKMDFTGKLGQNHYGDLRLYLDLPSLPTLNLDARIGQYSSHILYGDDHVRYGFGYWSHQESFYLSNISWTDVDFQLGIRNRFYKADTSTELGSSLSSVMSEKACKGNYGGLFANARFYTMDRLNYPSGGVDLYVGYDLDLAKSGCPDFKPYNVGRVDFRCAIPVCDFFAIIPDLHLRTQFGNGREQYASLTEFNTSYSFAHQNYVGGALSDRNIEGQVPFIGFNSVYQADANLAVLNLDLRFEPFKNVYASLLGGYLHENNNLGDFFKDFNSSLYAAGLELGYNSIIGPVKVRGSWSDMQAEFKDNLSIYFSFGYDF